jgi:cation transporter-like permease
VAAVLLLIVGGLFGVLAALVAGEQGGMVLNALVSAALGAGFSLYFVAVLAAIHRQLTGADPGEAARTFE